MCQSVILWKNVSWCEIEVDFVPTRGYANKPIELSFEEKSYVWVLEKRANPIDRPDL